METGRLQSVLADIGLLLECSLCLEECKDPRSLPCQHWFCLPCLTQLEVGKETIYCPNCTVEVKVPNNGVEGFPAAIVINNLKEIAGGGRGLEKPKATINCQMHGSMCELFCKECTELICKECGVQEHKRHSKVFIEEVADVHRKQIQERHDQLLCGVKKFGMFFQKLTEAKNKFLSEVTVNREAAVNHCDIIIQKVATSLTEIQSEIDDGKTQVMAEFDKMETNMTAEFSKLTQTVKEVESVLSDDDSAAIIDASINKLPDHKKAHGAEGPTLDKVQFPDMKVKLKLPDIGKMTRKTFLGDFKCTLKHPKKQSTPNKGTTCLSLTLRELVVIGLICAVLNHVITWIIVSQEGFPVGDLNVKKIYEFGLPYVPYAAAYIDNSHIILRENGYREEFHFQSGQGVQTITTEYPVQDVAYYEGYVYTTSKEHADSGQVFVYSRKGDVIDTIELNHTCTGCHLAVTEKYIFVASYHMNCVHRVSRQDKRENLIISSHYPGSMIGPEYVASNGRILAVSCNKFHELFVYDVNGNFLFKYGGDGSGPGKLSNPRGVAVDSSDRIFVSDQDNTRVSIVSSQGQHIGDIPVETGRPQGLTLTPAGRLVVLCSNKRVLMYEYSYSIWDTLSGK